VVAAPGLLIVTVMNEKVERIGDLFGPDVLYRLAERQAGYLTARQAVATGMPPTRGDPTARGAPPT
jgi:hypothetical protein